VPSDPTSDKNCAASNTILCHYGNGHYDFSTQILSVGITINFGEFKLPQLMRN